jgi:hypothetical protein
MSLDSRKYHFIYKTTNLKNNHFYIGMHSTNNLKDGYMGSGDRLRSSIRHYGKENHKFEILEFHESRDLVMKRESEIVSKELLKDPLCMNIMQGGYGFKDLEHFKKVCEAGNKVFKERLKDEAYLNEFREKTKENLRRATEKSKELYESGAFRLDTFKGRKHTPEALEKIRKADRTGIKNSQFGTFWICHPEFGAKKIKSSELDLYQSQGWKRGRILGTSE